MVKLRKFSSEFIWTEGRGSLENTLLKVKKKTKKNYPVYILKAREKKILGSTLGLSK